jgi:VWFA-related protein
MLIQRSSLLSTFLLLCLIFSSSLSSQQTTSPHQALTLVRRPHTSQLILDVAAANANGPVSNLAQQNFTVLIDKKPVPISDFHAVTLQSEQAEPTEILLVVDEVNTAFSSLTYERGQIRSFLEGNVGKLNHPVRFAFLTRDGYEIQAGNSRDANAVLAGFDEHTRDSNTFRGSSSGDAVPHTLVVLRKIAAEEAKRPGRKIVVWIASGWPIFNGIGGVELSAHERHHIFNTILSISTALRQSRITLYCVNSGGAASFSTYYEAFLKPVATASDVEEGDVNLQVLAVQSGGLVLKASNDVSSMLKQCMPEADFFYKLTVDAPLTGPEKFHKIEVRVNTPGMQVRTRNGYYG